MNSRITIRISLFITTIIFLQCFAFGQYQPNWESLDARPLPSWYDQAKFGIFIHWGVFSVPSYSCDNIPHAAEWYWWDVENRVPCVSEFHNKTYGPDFEYTQFAPMFQASLFDPTQWANLFEQSGAKYVVFTSKHHDGFTNWKSAQSWNWNSVESGPHIDIVSKLTAAIKNAGLRMGLYLSLFEWYNPLYLEDVANQGRTQNYVNEILMPQLMDIVNTFEPSIVWGDGAWGMNSTYWESPQFLAWLYNESPVKDEVCVNDRWGSECECVHGGYYTCHDRFNPGKKLNHKWENCLTIDAGSWGYNRNTNITGYLTIEDLITELVTTVSCGGNMLLNVGPSSDGTIIPVFQERLLQIGSWLNVNGQAIYKTVPWRAQNDSDSFVWYTTDNETNVYAIALEWPDEVLMLSQPVPTQDTHVSLMGYDADLEWNWTEQEGMSIQIPHIPFTQMPCNWAWVFVLTNVQ